MSGRRGPGPISQLITLVVAVAVFGGWWLYNGGTNGGLAGCWRQAVGVATWIAEKGRDAWDAVFSNNSPGTPTSPSHTTAVSSTMPTHPGHTK